MAVLTPKTFYSNISIEGKFKSDFPTEIVKNEPMFFNCDVDFAYENGGPITKEFLMKLPFDWHKNSVFDSRVHMLMKNWFPCIPGFHHDDVPRDKDGQPNYENPEYFSEHIMGLVNGEICPTIFACGECDMPSITNGEIVYKIWHNKVAELIQNNELQSYECKSGDLIKFNWQSFHTGQKAKQSGWRWFGRISRNTNRIKNITNEIRRQVQVYLEFPMEGW